MRWRITHSAVKNDYLRRLFLELRDSLTTERMPLEQESVLLDWVVFVNRMYTSESENSRPSFFSETVAIRRVRELITENFAENTKLQGLAEIAQLSPFHLSCVFNHALIKEGFVLIKVISSFSMANRFY